MFNSMIKARSKKGFTLMEMLIVVAIIAILVAISIPVFNSQLEKAREATDQANVRAAKAIAVANYLTMDTPAAKTYIYDAANGKLLDTAVAAAGYGKGTATSGNAATDEGNVVGGVIAVKVDAGGAFSYKWVAATTEGDDTISDTGLKSAPSTAGIVAA